MPVHVTLTLDKVFLRAGPSVQGFTIAGQLRPARPFDRLTRFGLMIHWPKSASWLRLSASGTADPATAEPGVLFSESIAALDAVCTEHEVERDRLAPPKFLEMNSFLVGSLPQHNRVFLKVEADTDDDAFRQAVRDNRNVEKSELVQTLEVFFFDAKQFRNLVIQAGKIDLVLKPCSPVPRFDGVLAIDLGNTTTTAVSLSEEDPVHQTNSVRPVPLEPDSPPGGDSEPMVSVIRLDRIQSPDGGPAGARRFPAAPADERSNAVQFVAGRKAALGAADGELPPGVVYGAKQLLAAKGSTGASEPHLTLEIPHAKAGGPPRAERVEVLNRLPAELLFMHVIRQFRNRVSAWPSDLTLTYPTTYGPHELRQLIRAAARGWLRAMNQPQSFGWEQHAGDDPAVEQLARQVREWLLAPEAGPCPLIRLTLDEATAAAIFHVHRLAFEQPGGLLRFRYLHRRGIHLLLIDCGGGTTDIALVHAESPPQSNNLLAMEVLARTGVRDFGGDSITRQICRLLKAKLALAAARVRMPGQIPASLQHLPAAAPADSDKARRLVEEFINAATRVEPNDELVPTRFNPEIADPDLAQRRTAAHSLWQLAERIKRKLGDKKPVKLRDLGTEAIGRETSPLVAAILRPLPLASQNALLVQVGELVIAPWEVNALIRHSVQSVVDKCNRLIGRHLMNGAEDEREVDVVVLSGNGARLPLIPDMIREHLNVTGLDTALGDRPDASEREDGVRLEIDNQNRKEAVAKGAAMARMVERIPRRVTIRFDRNLSERLPFNVGYHSMYTNETIPLFKEYTPLRDLTVSSSPVKLAVQPTAQSAVKFVLEHQFPGDESYSPFASYHFAEGIQGDLEVLYDNASESFVVRDSASGTAGEFKDLTGAGQPLPVLRGDI